jgi:hypothetical protein
MTSMTPGQWVASGGFLMAWTLLPERKSGWSELLDRVVMLIGYGMMSWGLR